MNFRFSKDSYRNLLGRIAKLYIIFDAYTFEKYENHKDAKSVVKLTIL